MRRPKHRHWLDRAKPKYWPPRTVWRVRAMRGGQHYQWVLQAGKGDVGSTGRAMAVAEWERTRLAIIKSEQPDEDEFGMTIFKSDEEANRHYAGVQERADFADSPFAATMSFTDWRELNDFKAWQQGKADAESNPQSGGFVPLLPQASGSKPFKDLTAIFLAHLKYRLAQTKPGMQSSEDISEARFHQYSFALAHMDASVGETPIKPAGEFHIDEKQLMQVLVRYRQLCKDQMSAKEFTGHWFNERMKTARSFVTYLVTNRLLSAAPGNLAAVVEKYTIEPNPEPIPLPILRAIWKVADEKFRGFMLIALNCGFRQSEIYNLDRSHLKRVANKLCIVKRRGKTKVLIAIPLWKDTEKFIDEHGNREGKLFTWPNAKTAIAFLYGQIKAIREKVAKRMPEAAGYSFEHFRDTGASYLENINPMLVPFYLGQGDTRQAKQYVGTIADEAGNPIVPMQLDRVLEMFERFLGLKA